MWKYLIPQALVMFVFQSAIYAYDKKLLEGITAYLLSLLILIITNTIFDLIKKANENERD